ncbi:hypothetical protein EZJ43_06085 [Pedobacter changchengzhani]|uniref:Uncharacterized protein n=1 Tax=Pedobacter changchengzhani TaxID=2529274 RepID=A0A4R5MM54_9SPHI|nr:hypothetical protein [Pedobacter changchengzhani]TDG36847.1 hypothetical protein EZJ43_06085 [Pedobacter changchengzhani]
MKTIISVILLYFISWYTKPETKILERNSNPQQHKQIITQEDLFKLDFNSKGDYVKITPSKKSGFKFPDKSAKTAPVKFGDFNADHKKDVLVNLGACGTGGCMYGLFLKQYNNFYKLVFMDYLKNMEFKVEKNGLWTIESSEEIEAYNPSKLRITVFKFDKKKYRYKLDRTYTYIDEE